MKVSEIKELTDKELVERIETERTNQLRMRINHAVSPLENPLKLNAGRKVIARLLTVKRQRQSIK